MASNWEQIWGIEGSFMQAGYIGKWLFGVDSELTKDGITTAVIINKTATFTGTTYASRYTYDNKLKRHTEIIKRQKEAVRMIKHIFPQTCLPIAM